MGFIRVARIRGLFSPFSTRCFQNWGGQACAYEVLRSEMNGIVTVPDSSQWVLLTVNLHLIDQAREPVSA